MTTYQVPNPRGRKMRKQEELGEKSKDYEFPVKSVEFAMTERFLQLGTCRRQRCRMTRTVLAQHSLPDSVELKLTKRALCARTIPSTVHG